MASTSAGAHHVTVAPLYRIDHALSSLLGTRARTVARYVATCDRCGELVSDPAYSEAAAVAYWHRRWHNR